MSAALAVTHQLRRGTGDNAVCSGLRPDHDVQDCGTVATTPTAAPAAATLLAAAQVAPCTAPCTTLSTGWRHVEQVTNTGTVHSRCAVLALRSTIVPVEVSF